MQLSLNIPQLDRFTDDELVRFCLANPELNIERDENGDLFIDTSLASLLTSANNSELNGEIGIWNRKTKAGKFVDSNGGFFLNDKSMKAPDVAWIRRERWDALSKKEKHSFPQPFRVVFRRVPSGSRNAVDEPNISPFRLSSNQGKNRLYSLKVIFPVLPLVLGMMISLPSGSCLKTKVGVALAELSADAGVELLVG